MFVFWCPKISSKKTITIINKEAYFDLVGKNELDIIISPVQITVSHVLKYIRKGSVTNVHKVKKGMAEAIEIVVDSSYQKLKGRLISDLRLDENINIPALKRGENVLMAHGDTEIHDEDHLIVFYKDKGVIDDFYNTFRWLVCLNFLGFLVQHYCFLEHLLFCPP